MTPVPVVGIATLSRAGTGWRTLGEAALAMERGTRVALPGMPDETPLASPRARKMMSRGAYLAARCLGDLLADAGWRRDNVGYFLGVGASGGSLDDVTALLDASIADGEFSLARFGEAGLAACNPLLAFQLMNNFTLCHGAIFEGITGPNAALFSRGGGTTAALVEAIHAIAGGDCDHAIAGGADSAVHPVTRAELVREGFVERGQVPAEGAALLALGTGATGARRLAVVEAAAYANGHGRALPDTLGDAIARLRIDLTGVDLVVLAPWGPEPAAALRAWATASLPAARVVDTSAVFGDALAAGPALAWATAIDLLVGARGTRALVLGAGVDRDVGAAVFAGGDA